MAYARYLRLLAYLILGLFLGANIVIAHAETIPAESSTVVTGYTATGFFTNPTVYPTAEEACQAQIAYQWPNESLPVCLIGTQCGRVQEWGCDTFNGWAAPATTETAYSCPSTGGWTLSGSSCTRADCAQGETRDQNGVCQPPTPTCQAGEVLEGGVCKPDCNHPSRDLSGQNFGGSGAYTAGGQLCIGGCTYNTNNGITGCKDGNCTYESQVGAATGDRCTPPENPVTVKNDQTRTPEEKCISQGQGYVSSGGVITCVGATSPSNPVTITQTSSPATTSTTSGGVTTTTETQTTTTVDPKTGTVTQTTTTTPSGGGAPTTEETTQPKDKFCEENPDAAICKNGSFGGTCTAGFICDGDAIQCAIARAKYRENCELFDNATPLSNLGNSLGQGVDPSGDLTTFKAGTVVNLPGTLDQTNPYSQAGLSDLVVQIGNGHSVTIPFTNLNYYLELMGHILVALSLLAAGRIVGAY